MNISPLIISSIRLVIFKMKSMLCWLTEIADLVSVLFLTIVIPTKLIPKEWLHEKYSHAWFVNAYVDKPCMACWFVMEFSWFVYLHVSASIIRFMLYKLYCFRKIQPFVCLLQVQLYFFVLPSYIIIISIYCYRWMPGCWFCPWFTGSSTGWSSHRLRSPEVWLS